jgi:beta-glucosidase-like glycosyl hydrolase
MSDLIKRIEKLIGAVIIPEFRPIGGESPDAPERRPSDAYLKRFPPVGMIGFGRRMPDGLRIDGLAQLTADLVQSAYTLTGQRVFVCADLECGAGYHLPGASLLPPARALAAAESTLPGAVAGAAELTGREARAAGIDLVLAPVLDVNTNPANPIIGVRAFGRTVSEVTAMGRAFVEGLQRAGAGACIKHYPGHGDTHQDSHLTLPTIARSVEQLEQCELAPFRSVLAGAAGNASAGALAVMVAHLDVPALTGEDGLATSLSPAVMEGLRREGFDGVVMTDGLAMKSVAELPDLGVRSLAAGCDGLLAPICEQTMAEQLLEAVLKGRLSERRLEEAALRMGRLQAQLASTRTLAPTATLPQAQQLACAALAASPDFERWRREFFGKSLHLKGTTDFEHIAQSLGVAHKPAADGMGPVVVVAGSQNIAENGVSGLGQAAADQVVATLQESHAAGCKTGFVWFGAPEGLLGDHLARFHAEMVRCEAPTLVAFAPSDVMVGAVGDLLASSPDNFAGDKS